MALASQAKAIPKGDLHPMAKVIPITEQVQHFMEELQESLALENGTLPLGGRSTLAGMTFPLRRQLT